MTAVLFIAGIETEVIRRDYLLVKAFLENVGSQTIGPGAIVARQISDDASMRSIEFFNSVSLLPGEKTRVTQLVRGYVKELEFRSYRESDGENIPLCGVVKRSLLRRSMADVAENFVTDLLAPLKKTWTTFTGTEKTRKP